LDKELVGYLLPEGVLDYFEITGHKSTKDRIDFYLKEQNIVPEEYKTERLHSKGFTPEITIEDFPLRGKSVFLHITHRRWQIVETKKDVKRDWNLVAKGTRITSEFASFLKGIS